MAWERRRIDTGIERINFAVNADRDPELYAWIQSLPFGKASAIIKSVLLDHIERGGDHIEYETARIPRRVRRTIDAPADLRPALPVDARVPAPAPAPAPEKDNKVTDDTVISDGDDDAGAMAFLALQSQFD